MGSQPFTVREATSNLPQALSTETCSWCSRFRTAPADFPATAWATPIRCRDTRHGSAAAGSIHILTSERSQNKSQATARHASNFHHYPCDSVDSCTWDLVVFAASQALDEHHKRRVRSKLKK